MIASSTLEKLEYHKVIKYIANYAVTEPGKSFILNSTPSVDSSFIKREGTIVQEAKEILIKQVPPPIEYIPDLSDTLAKSKIDGAVLQNKKILDVYNLAAASRKVFSYLKQNSDIAPNLNELNNHLIVDKVFEHHIEQIINNKGEVKDKASKKLADIRKELNNRQSDLLKSINSIMKNLEEQGMVREEYLTLRDGRMVIPIKAEHKRHLRGFIHSESSTGQTVYIEPEQTLELNNEIISLSFAEKREVERLLKELTKLIGSKSEELKSSLDTISYIDAVFAKAKYSLEIIGSFPQIDNNKPLLLKDVRHPVLLKKIGRQQTVPLTFRLDNENVVLITGPNAGGKTVVLKTIGLVSMLLQSGVHIPADPDSNMHIFSNILIDIGDEQSIEDDLSTFSSHLLNIKQILNQASENSLVLLDEIGTGTDPAEGCALAAAVLMNLRDKRTTTFASTHHGSLKLIANDEDGFINAAMEFDNENLSPTYKFKLGVPGSSYAFEIAKRIGIESKLLETASKNIDEDKHKIENFLVEIESKSAALEKKLNQMELENVRLSGLSNLYKKNVEKLEKEKKQILKKVKSDAEVYLQNINKKIEGLIKELRETGAKKEVIKKSKKLVENLKKENENLFTGEVELETKISDFKVGDFVNLKGTAANGFIIKLNKEKGKAVVESGAIKLQVKIDELLPSKNKPVKNKHVHNYNLPATDYRIDLRGKKPEEIEFSVLRFIDDSFVAGQQRVEILHGKGTGALKNTVIEILKHHEKIKDFYFAPIEAGGEGVTIVELK